MCQMISSGYVLTYFLLVNLIRIADTAEIALEITIKLNHMKTRLHFYQNKIHDALTILVCRTTKVITNVAVTSFSSPNKDVEYMNNFCRRSYNDTQTSTWCKVIQRGNNNTSFTALNFIDNEIRKPTYSGGETEIIHKMQHMNLKKAQVPNNQLPKVP